jgi:hypothetical protein
MKTNRLTPEWLTLLALLSTLNLQPSTAKTETDGNKTMNTTRPLAGWLALLALSTFTGLERSEDGNIQQQTSNAQHPMKHTTHHDL